MLIDSFRLLWGAVLMLTATCFNAETLLVTRFFLGALESTVGPGLTVIIAMWYSKYPIAALLVIVGDRLLTGLHSEI